MVSGCLAVSLSSSGNASSDGGVIRFRRACDLARAEADAVKPHTALSRRERQVLEALAHGMTEKQVSDALGITDRTTAFHVMRLYSKLGLDYTQGNKRVLATLYAIRAGIVAP